ncbi:MAG: FHA domain-containing protein [Planctomycetota bacterium]
MTPALSQTTEQQQNDSQVVRLTAAKGTPGQKVWHLHHPATLIGSKRPAQIVLHDPEVEAAHLVVLNTGRQVLIRDLGTASGTMLNGQPVKIAASLSDGDVITVGETVFDVNVESESGGSITPASNAETLGFVEPMGLCAEELNNAWRIERPVVTLGSHPQATIRLEHANVSERHAVLFPYGDGAAVADTGSERGVFVNGERVNFAPVSESDCVLIGPFALRLVVIRDGLPFPPWDRDGSAGSDSREANSPFAKLQASAGPADADQAENAGEWDEVADKLREKDSESWNDTFVVPKHDAPDQETTDPNAGAYEARLDTLRVREEALDQREAEVDRREKILLQRWTKLLALKCRNCGTAINMPGKG